MAFIDLRSQLVRYTEDGSTYVNPENPSPQTLIEKPFDFKYNLATNRTTDLERFLKFLKTSSGLKFQANYAILQQSQQELNQKVAASQNGSTRAGNFLRAAGTRALGTFLGNVGFTANIAKQIPVMGTGVHFVNNTSGRYYIDSTAGSSKVVKDLFNNFLRNVGITGGKSNPLPNFDPEGSGRVTSILKDAESDYRPAYNYEEDYQGKERTRNLIGGKYDGPPLPGKSSFESKFNLPIDNSLIEQAIVPNTGALKGTGVGTGSDNSDLRNYKNKYEKVKGKLVGKNIERLSAVNPSSIVAPDGKAYTVKNTLDKKFGVGKNTIAGLDIIESTTLDTTLEEETAIQEAYGEQIIPFSFTSITPDKSSTIFFNAFLDSYRDGFQGTWNGTQYIGRGEQFYTYQGFGRDINFSFKVAAFNEGQLKNMYRKLNSLAGTTAPNYSSEGNFMRGTLTRLTIGDLIYRLNGFVSSIGLNWNTTYPWEIDVNQKKSLNKVPHLLDVEVSFTPIHNFNVKSDLDFEAGEGYFGAKLRTTKSEVNRLTPAGITPIQPQLPKVSNFTIPKKTVGIVEGEQGSFGGPFDQGDFVNIDDLPDSAFEI